MSTASAKSRSRQRPVHEVRFGRVRAAIWENQTDGGVQTPGNSKRRKSTHATLQVNVQGVLRGRQNDRTNRAGAPPVLCTKRLPA